MRAKSQGTLGVIVILLALCAISSLIVALLLAFYPGFSLRSFLLSQQLANPQSLLNTMISLFGVLSAGFIAAIALIFVNRQTQTYSWRRDQALKDIETMYEPLYKDVGEVVNAIETFENFHWQSANWNSINNSYLGTKLELIEKEIHERLGDLFSDLKRYPDRRWNALEMVRAIAKTVIEPYLVEGLPAETRQLILNNIPASLDYEGFIYRGFLIGKSVREWSSMKFRGEGGYLIEWSRKEIEGKSYWQHLQLTLEQIEAILNEIYQKVQDDSQIRQIVDWCNTVGSKARHLKKELEERILRPQLP